MSFVDYTVNKDVVNLIFGLIWLILSIRLAAHHSHHCGQSKGPFTQAIFVAATQCNFCHAKVATSKSHV